MKYIRNISDEQNKVGDTDNVFRLNLFEDTELFNFGTNALTVNIANSSGYILSLTPKKETGNTVIDLDFNDAPLKSLTPDDYLLEVEVKFSDGTTATFPTKGGMPFTVNGNLKETSGTLVPTVTFDNVLDAVDKKIAVYMDTVKVGPRGLQGPAGDVDASLDNTFTGVNKFTQRIQGAIATRLANFTDLATVAADMYSYQGIWWFGSGQLLNSPVSSYAVVEVFHGSTTTNGYIRITSSISGDSYYANVNNGLQTWNKYAKDTTVVHNTGTETIAGNKTFTSPIYGRFVSKDVDVTDFNDIAKSMYAHAGIINVRGTALENSPEPGMTWYTVVVNPSIDNNAGSMVAYASDKMFYTGVGSGVIQGWRKLANDNQVVHVAGTETISGNKTFTGDNNFSGATTLKTGNYGLRVTTSGIQKTSDGGTTWTNI